MKSRALWTALGVVVITASVVQAAQHDAHQAAGTTEQSAGAMQCAQAQLSVSRIIEAAQARLEMARQSNSPSAMRAAIDDLGKALRDIRVQLGPCAAIAATDPHAGHAMPSAAPTAATGSGTPGMKTVSPAPAPTAAPATAKPTTTVADPDAGHTMPAPKASSPAPSRAPTSRAKPQAGSTDSHAGHAMPAAAAAKPSSAPSRAPAPTAKSQGGSADSHDGHAAAPAQSQSSESPLTQAVDPVCGLRVDPKEAPTAPHQGQTLYFCSEQHQQLFLKDSPKYAPKGKR